MNLAHSASFHSREKADYVITVTVHLIPINECTVIVTPKHRPEPAHHLTHGTITGERGKPDDVAAMVRSLCSPAARYVTGQAIHANGGAYLGA